MRCLNKSASSYSFKKAEAIAKAQGIDIFGLPDKRRGVLKQARVLFTGTFQNERDDLNQVVESEKGSV